MGIREEQRDAATSVDARRHVASYDESDARHYVQDSQQILQAPRQGDLRVRLAVGRPGPMLAVHHLLGGDIVIA